MVRHGISDKGVGAWEDVIENVIDKVIQVPAVTDSATWDWEHITPEEEGFDSVKLAQALLHE